MIYLDIFHYQELYLYSSVDKNLDDNYKYTQYQ